jgi:hypothetical protein
MSRDPPRDMRPTEAEALDQERKREQRTLAETTERYLELLKAEKEKARRQGEPATR